jgi:CRP-like cAMP-binding protein
MTVVAEIREKLEKRIAELEPLVAEHEQLTRLLAELDGPSAAAKTSRARAPAKSRARTRSRSRARRAPGGGGQRETRAAQSLRIVSERPGISAMELAEQLGIDVNYLYRVLPKLEKSGQIERRGRGWYAASG